MKIAGADEAGKTGYPHGPPTGAFAHPGPVHSQPAGFVLNPAGNVVVSVYSSGAIGRLVPDDVIGLVRYVREHSAPATT